MNPTVPLDYRPSNAMPTSPTGAAPADKQFFKQDLVQTPTKVH